MKIQISTVTTGGVSQIFDFEQLKLEDLQVLIEALGEVTITKQED